MRLWQKRDGSLRHGRKALASPNRQARQRYVVLYTPFAPAAKERREFAPKGARLCEPEPTGAVKRYIVFYIPVCACGKREAGVCAMGARLCEPEPTGAVKISYFISPFAPVAKERREFAPWEQGSASPNRQARQDISRRFVPVCACGKREAGVCA